MLISDKKKKRAAWEVDVIIISFLKVEKVSQCELKYLAKVIQWVSGRACG